MEPLNPNRKSKKSLNQDEGEGGNATLPQPPSHGGQGGGHKQVLHDEMVQLAQVLYSCAKDPMAVSIVGTKSRAISWLLTVLQHVLRNKYQLL